MSLRDTIRGAREEASANASARSTETKPSNDANLSEDSLEGEKKGFSKRSLSRAKPAREAAAGVRVVDTKGNSHGGKVPQTKEERKEARRRERDLEDMRSTISNILLEQNPDYPKRRRTWWIIMGVGFGAMIVTLILSGVASQDVGTVSGPLGIASIILMVLAYAAIIGALIYDWVRVHPLRKACDAVAGGMSVKKMESVLDQDARDRAKAKAEKEARKGK